jgi:hypothetical protein
MLLGFWECGSSSSSSLPDFLKTILWSFESRPGFCEIEARIMKIFLAALRLCGIRSGECWRRVLGVGSDGGGKGTRVCSVGR